MVFELWRVRGVRVSERRNADLLRFAENTGEERHPKMRAIRDSGMEIASNLAIRC